MFEISQVGDQTEYGKVYEGSQIENKIKTPLNIQLEKLSRWITFAGYSIAAFIVLGRLTQYFLTYDSFVWLDFGHYILNTLMIAVALIVVAVPEGLPMSVTLSLALSMRRMLDNHNLVRKMHACETVGATTVICTDKTGTLTQNQMQVTDTLFFSLPDQKLGQDSVSKLIKEGISANTTAFLDLSEEKPKVLGNPTEGALLLWLNASGINYLSCREHAKVAGQLPFSTENKYMATLIEKGEFEQPTLYLKGAPE
jgi:Ca2+-transporting ATPase